MGNEDKKSKYDRAVDAARGIKSTDLETTKPGELDTSILPAGMLVDSAAVGAELAAKIKSGEWEQAPQLLTLKAGQTIMAILEGNGAPAEFVDEDTGVVNHEQTWILSRDGVRVSILGSAQLNKKLPPFVGGAVAITRGAEVRNGSRVYTDYLVLGPKRPDGKVRDWSGRAMLAAPSSSSAPEVKPS